MITGQRQALGQVFADFYKAKAPGVDVPGLEDFLVKQNATNTIFKGDHRGSIEHQSSPIRDFLKFDQNGLENDRSTKGPWMARVNIVISLHLSASLLPFLPKERGVPSA